MHLHDLIKEGIYIMAEKNVNEMSFLDHLEDLRWHLIRAFSAIVIVGSFAYMFSKHLFNVIIFAPLKMSFPTYRFLCKVGTLLNVDTTFCAEKMPLIFKTERWLVNFQHISGHPF